DYRIEAVPGLPGLGFRGPVPDLGQPFVACVGGAQTFGRFVAEPFPTQLARGLGMPVLNLGLGGAGPRFAGGPDVLAILSRARAVVVQCFAGRSASNSLFDAGAGRNTGRCLRTGRWLRFEEFLREVRARDDLGLLQRVVHETRDDWAVGMRHIARSLPVPTVLSWLSARTPDYTIDWRSDHGVLNTFPQLLDRDVIERVRPEFTAYCECVCAEGLPQRLWPASAPIDGAVLRDGWLWNEYYPSQRAHDAAAAQLLPVLRAWTQPR
ncbi:MAG: hypothetical protein JNK15_15405, partial [Planctomycetes bacterium]|nr:hypothetical protein [Planctomycetota bacterium]